MIDQNPRGSRPYVVERDGKDTVSQLFPPSKTLKVLAIVSDATVKVMHFARTGSQRQADSKTNKNVMLCNRVDIFDKGKQKRENAAHKAKKEVARKRRERRGTVEIGEKEFLYPSNCLCVANGST
jgi:hypothetical protein